jgi:hypothetical protein
MPARACVTPACSTLRRAANRTFACAVKRRWSTAGRIPPGNWFAPPGSNRSSSGGNEAAEASGVEGRVGDLASLQAVTIVNAVQAPKRVMQEPTRRESREGRRRWEMSEQSHRSCRGIGDGMQTKGTRRNTGSPSGDRSQGQPATRKRQAGPSGVTERPVVPRKPGNAGGGKGPQLKGDARSDEGPRDWR